MGSPLPHKRQAVGAPLPPLLPAVYMPAEIPVEVDMLRPKSQRTAMGHTLSVTPWKICSIGRTLPSQAPTTLVTPDPLKRRSKKKKSQSGLANHLEPHLLESLDVEMSPVVEQGGDTCSVPQQGATMHPAVKQGTKQRPVASLPMSITGQLPCPLGKVVAIHTIRPLQWYDECELMDPWFVEAAAIACNTLAVNCTSKQCGVYHRHHHACRDTQPLHFAVDVDTPDDIHHWIEE